MCITWIHGFRVISIREWAIVPVAIGFVFICVFVGANSSRETVCSSPATLGAVLEIHIQYQTAAPRRHVNDIGIGSLDTLQPRRLIS